MFLYRQAEGVSTSDVRVPTQDRAIRTRAALVEAARVEFSARGYAATTAKSIAERAGVAVGSFYQYFRDKDAALRELAEARYVSIGGETANLLAAARAFNGTAAEARALAGLPMRRIVEIVIAFHREDPALHAVLTERRHADPELDTLTSDAEAALVARIAVLLRAFGREGDVDALAFTLFGMVEGSVHAHVLGRPLVSDERLTRTLVDALVVLALP